MERRVSKCGERTLQVNDAESPNDSDDFSFNKMKLKDFRSICKLKKRKVQKSVDSQQSVVKGFSEDHCLTVKIKEEPEMEETLGCLKVKLSNSKPKRRNKLLKSPHPLSGAGLEKVSAEQDTVGELCVLKEIKSEVVDMDSDVLENVSAVIGNCSLSLCSSASGNELHNVVDGCGNATRQFSSIEEVNLNGEALVPLPEVWYSSDSGNTTSSALSAECPLHCSVNEASNNSMEHEQFETVCGDAKICHGIGVMSSSDTIHGGSPLLRSELTMDDEKTCSLFEGKHCAVSDEKLAIDHVSNAQSAYACNSNEGLETQKNIQPTTASDHGDHSVDELIRLHTTFQSFPSCLPSNNVSEYLEEDVGSVVTIFPEVVEAREALYSLTGSSDAVMDQDCTIKPRCKSRNSGVGSVSSDILSVVESQSNRDKDSTSFDYNNSINGIIGCQSTYQNLSSCFNSSESSQFSDNAYCFSMETDVGEHKLSSRDTVAEAEASNGLDGLKLKISPTRLLSTRKAISPLSQEKLLQAVDAEELQPNIQNSKGKKRLCFENGTENETCSGRPYFEDADGRECHRERSKKLRLKCKSGSPPLLIKGILKTQNNECSSSQKNARQAVMFSQMQMRHFETIAANLLNCLNSMKDIVGETLHSEGFSFPSKFTPEMKREATDNANELEATTKKWLAMMSRDCNRFCKLMNLSEEKAASPAPAPKERKKISFADEAGLSLCHVKTFTKCSQLVSEN